MSVLKEYIVKLEGLRSNSALSIIEIGALLVEAKKKLSDSEYIEFLSETKYSNKKSTLRKWNVIGNSSVRLSHYINLLPCNWTTIYKIASLKASEFDQLIKDQLIHPEITAKEISEALKTPKKRKTSYYVKFEVDLNEDPYSLCSLIKYIDSSLLNTKCVISPDLKDHIESYIDNNLQIAA